MPDWDKIIRDMGVPQEEPFGPLDENGDTQAQRELKQFLSIPYTIAGEARKTIPLERKMEGLRGAFASQAFSGAATQRMRDETNQGLQRRYTQGNQLGFGGNLEQAVRRGKARAGIEARGDAAIQNQRLKDRITLAKAAVSKRSQGMNMLSNARRFQAGIQEATRDAALTTKMATMDMLGGITGSIFRASRDDGPFVRPTVQSMSEGGATSDYMRQIDFGKQNFDVYNTPPPVGAETQTGWV